MSYNPNIPNASDPRAQSQKQINANFQTINTVWAVNHSSLTGTETQGQHDVLTIRPQSVDPTTASNQIALYNKLDTNSIPELFFRPKSNGTPIQLTYPSVNAGDITNDIQYSFIAGPFVVYMGIIRNSTPSGIPNGQTITLTPSTTLIYANLTTYNGFAVLPKEANAVATDLTANTFKIKFDATMIIKVLYYTAIGKP